MSRVLLLGSYAPSLVLFRAPLLRALVEAGHQVIASAPDEGRGVPSAMEDLGVRWHPINFKRNRERKDSQAALATRLPNPLGIPWKRT